MEIVLLTPEREIAARVGTEAMAAFIHQIESCAETTLGMHTDPCKILAQLTCTPGAQAIQVGYQGPAKEALIQAFCDAATQLPPVPVREGSVVFHIHMDVGATGA